MEYDADDHGENTETEAESLCLGERYPMIREKRASVKEIVREAELCRKSEEK